MHIFTGWIEKLWTLKPISRLPPFFIVHNNIRIMHAACSIAALLIGFLLFAWYLVRYLYNRLIKITAEDITTTNYFFVSLRGDRGIILPKYRNSTKFIFAVGQNSLVYLNTITKRCPSTNPGMLAGPKKIKPTNFSQKIKQAVIIILENCPYYPPCVKGKNGRTRRQHLDHF